MTDLEQQLRDGARRRYDDMLNGPGIVDFPVESLTEWKAADYLTQLEVENARLQGIAAARGDALDALEQKERKTNDR